MLIRLHIFLLAEHFYQVATSEIKTCIHLAWVCMSTHLSSCDLHKCCPQYFLFRNGQRWRSTGGPAGKLADPDLNRWPLNGRSSGNSGSGYIMLLLCGLEGRTASSCQISSKSVQPRLKYGNFSIFQDGGRRHLGFSKF